MARGVNNIVSFDALEYTRLEGSNAAQLATDLNNNIPDILEVPGHFIVAKGITQTSFSINDPFYEERKTLASYSGTFLSMGRFVPSHTDLSYIMIVLDTHVEATLKDNLENSVGTTFIQNALINQVNPNQKSLPAKKIIYLPKPETGLYNLMISGNNTNIYTAKVFLYDEQGNVISSTSAGVFGTNNTDSLLINFNKSGNLPTNIERSVTFQSIISDIKDLRSKGEIKKEKLKTDLIKLMQKAEVITKERKMKKNELKQKFNDFEKDIKQNRKKDMTEEAYQILIYDLIFLKKLYIK